MTRIAVILPERLGDSPVFVTDDDELEVYQINDYGPSKLDRVYQMTVGVNRVWPAVMSALLGPDIAYLEDGRLRARRKRPPKRS